MLGGTWKFNFLTPHQEGRSTRAALLRKNLLRQLRNPSRRPGGAEGVHLLLDASEIDLDQLVQAVEEWSQLRLGAGQLVAVRRRGRGRRGQAIHGRVHAVEQRRRRGLVVPVQDR